MIKRAATRARVRAFQAEAEVVEEVVAAVGVGPEDQTTLVVALVATDSTICSKTALLAEVEVVLTRCASRTAITTRVVCTQHHRAVVARRMQDHCSGTMPTTAT